ncbi:MAG: protein translocase subunit SecF [Thermomicrobium sp.]|jgi:preprotein translocase subunit SecF|uniref:Protein-export membrane protein SecF n=1 Tax=Thermomicrobium roseum (strain ATCC 27502 / DSM 5159 / P-2) TaxID=309801 RepID=B9KYU5_THERP|nr:MULTISPECIES: protein translocase subunit SecF [Thermomicrobium]ACM04509.1 protein-export membrane protein SecF [Thermomicrobium roseum DSM 5159]MBO9350006.1 protein translocase subunit SecF [Thermomicrobium sp.]MBO9403531.1 protein translocase subunit SecF [Thermomicrobium sp.]
MLDLVGKRYYWFLLSLIVIIPGLVSLAVHGLRLSIDFTGGTLWEIQLSRPVQPGDVRQVLAQNGIDDAIVQTADNNVVLIRMRELKEGSPEKEKLTQALRASFGDITELRLESVGPTLGTAIRNRAITAVALTTVGILLYIAWAFRNTNNPFLYGIAAIIAMLHDVAVVLGVFSILGWLRGVEVDALFVTALLTVIGFSVHDTIVVFDRIRENLARRAAPTFEQIVNYSLVQTLVRSINTSLTVVLTLLALYLLGGETIRTFVLALLIGIVSGTYSSIFNASQIVVVWENRELHRLFARLRRQHAPA